MRTPSVSASATPLPSTSRRTRSSSVAPLIRSRLPTSRGIELGARSTVRREKPSPVISLTRRSGRRPRPCRRPRRCSRGVAAVAAVAGLRALDLHDADRGGRRQVRGREVDQRRPSSDLAVDHVHDAGRTRSCGRRTGCRMRGPRGRPRRSRRGSRCRRRSRPAGRGSTCGAPGAGGGAISSLIVTSTSLSSSTLKITWPEAGRCRPLPPLPARSPRKRSLLPSPS